MRRRKQEGGYALLFVFLMAAVIAISLWMEIPRVAFETQRQKEQLLIDRGEQYKRAIRMFLAANKRWPSKIEDLESFNNRRFLRKRFVDPMTGKEEWRIIHIANGILTDSLVQKPKGPQQNQGSQSQLVAEIPVSAGDVTPGQATVNLGNRRRASDGMTLPPGVGAQGGGQVYDPNNPNNPQNPAYPGQPYPGQTYPGMPGQQGQVYPPGTLPPGVPGMPGQPGANVYPGQQQYPGQQYPGQPQYPGQSGYPGQPQYPGQPVQYPGQPTQYPGQQPQYPGQQPQYPGYPGQPVNSQVGGVSPYQPAGGNAAQMIQQILTSPRPGGAPGYGPYGPQAGAFDPSTGSPYGTNPGANGNPPQPPSGIGASGIGSSVMGASAASLAGTPGSVVGAGIAGVASNADSEGIMVYNDHTNYKEWEFIFDPTKVKPIPNPLTGALGTSAASMGSGTGQAPGVSPGDPSAPGQMPGQVPGQAPGTMAQPSDPFFGSGQTTNTPGVRSPQIPR